MSNTQSAFYPPHMAHPMAMQTPISTDPNFWSLQQPDAGYSATWQPSSALQPFSVAPSSDGMAHQYSSAIYDSSYFPTLDPAQSIVNAPTPDFVY